LARRLGQPARSLRRRRGADRRLGVAIRTSRDARRDRKRPGDGGSPGKCDAPSNRRPALPGCRDRPPDDPSTPRRRTKRSGPPRPATGAVRYSSFRISGSSETPEGHGAIQREQIFFLESPLGSIVRAGAIAAPVAVARQVNGTTRWRTTRTIPTTPRLHPPRNERPTEKVAHAAPPPFRKGPPLERRESFQKIQTSQKGDLQVGSRHARNRASAAGFADSRRAVRLPKVRASRRGEKVAL